MKKKRSLEIRDLRLQIRDQLKINKFKIVPGLCAWCNSEDIFYPNFTPIFDEDFVKFKFICNKCGKKSIEIFHMEFYKIEADIE